MDYGFAFLSAVDIHKDVALAERKGFTHAWLYDTQMLCADVFRCLALCAVKTKKIRLRIHRSGGVRPRKLETFSSRPDQ
jgi:hypothetical protein